MRGRGRPPGEPGFDPQAANLVDQGRRPPRPALFLPVYQPREPVFQLARQDIDGCIVNAYFLYKQRDLRERLSGPSSLKAHVGFDGLIATDSGALSGTDPAAVPEERGHRALSGPHRQRHHLAPWT